MDLALQISATLVGFIGVFWVGWNIPRDRIVEFLEENKDIGGKLSATRLRQLSALVVALGMCVYGTLFAFASVDVEIIWGLLLYSAGESAVSKGREVWKNKVKNKPEK